MIIDKANNWLTICKIIRWKQEVVGLFSGRQSFSANDGCRRTEARHNPSLLLSHDRFFAIITNERGCRGFCTCSSSNESSVKKQLRELHPSEGKRWFEAKTFAEQVKRLDHYSAFVCSEALTLSTEGKINDSKMKLITLINSLAIKLVLFIDLRYPKWQRWT